MSSVSVRGYDRLAPVYAGLERLAFGSRLMRARTALLNDLPPLKNVLMLGEGDGRFLKAFLERQPDCSVTVLEQSSRMLELAQSRLTPQQKLRVTFLQEDVVTYALEPARYDTVVTVFFLDCFSEAVLADLVPRLAASLKAGGLWYYADFATPPRGWRKVRARVYLDAMHLFFRWQTGLQPRALADPTPLFERVLAEVQRLEQSHGLLTTRLYRLEPSNCIFKCQ